MNELHRGEIYYISRGGVSPQGSEQYPDRPAVIVSNEKNNEHSNTVEIVYMTTQPKNDLPTHTMIRSTGRLSTVLCEQVYSISVERIGDYIGQVSEQEMQNINTSLMISLALDGGTKTSKQYNETIQRQQEEIESLKAEIVDLQVEITDKESINATQEQYEAQNGNREALIRLEAERDTFKALYESLIGKMMTS